ncbi:MAG TPA: DUF3618 domain-containing protein [Dermatophilaceae bacterium]|nr:DUF3618 domain-containing protein [Dermatophilaceae bacterium]
MGAEDNKSIRQIEADIESTRDQLASTIDQLVYRTKPATIIQRQKAQARAALHDATYHPDGSLRTERVAAVSAAVLFLVVVGIYRRRRS